MWEIDFEQWTTFVVSMSVGAILTVLVIAAGSAEPAWEPVKGEQVQEVKAADLVVEPAALVTVALVPVEERDFPPSEAFVADYIGEAELPVGCGSLATARMPWVLPSVLRRRGRPSGEATVEPKLQELPETFIVRRTWPDGLTEYVGSWDFQTQEVEWVGSPSRAWIFRSRAWAEYWGSMNSFGSPYELVAVEVGGPNW